jgi:hypothetical protein
VGILVVKFDQLVSALLREHPNGYGESEGR